MRTITKVMKDLEFFNIDPDDENYLHIRKDNIKEILKKYIKED